MIENLALDSRFHSSRNVAVGRFFLLLVEGKDRMPDLFSVKALSDDGTRIGGYVIVFGSAAAPDLTGDYFTPQTDLCLDLFPVRPVFYDHGLDSAIKTAPVGVIDTLRAPDEPPNYLVSPEFGLFWAIRADQRGKGYAGEAAHTIIDYLFQTMHVRRVIATTEHANAASQRVMQKLGMTIHRNPSDKPFWFEVVGVLDHPWHKRDIMSSTAGR